MNLFQISILCGLPTTIILGLVVFLNQPHRRANQAFFIMTSATTVWLSCLWMASIAHNIDSAVFWIRQSSATASTLPVAINLLRLTSRSQSESWRRILWRARFWWIMLIAIASLCQTSFFLVTATLPRNPTDIAMPTYGPGFIIFAAFFVISLIVLVAQFIRDHRAASGVRRLEFGFIILACSCGVFFGVVLLIIPNVTGFHEIGQLLPLAAIVFNSVIAYGLATRQILHVTHVIRRMAASLIMVFYLSAIYSVTWYVMSWTLEHFITTRLPLAHLAASIIVAMSITPAKWRLKRIVDSLFVDAASLDLSASIRDAGHILNTISTVPDLLQRFASLISQTLQSDTVRIFLAGPDGLAQHHAQPATLPPMTLSFEDPLVVTLQEENQPVVCEMVQRMHPRKALIQAEARMQMLDVEAAIGIRSKGQLTGAILLGPRVSGIVYGRIEQAVLTGLCDQLAVALDNAKLYTEVQNGRIYNDLLLDYLVNGVVATDMQRRITVCNREAERILRIHPRHLQRQSASALPESLLEIISRTFATHTEIRDQQIVIPGRDGVEDIPLNVGSTLFHGHTGEPLGVLLVFNDLTAVHKLEQQVRRTDRLASLGTLAAGMAHEIKNPLVTVKTFTQLLPERFDEEEFRASFTEMVGHEVTRIDTLVNQLLHFARPSKPSLLPIRIHPLICNTLNLISQSMKQKRISVTTSLDAECDLILGDADLLVQALINFLLNAIESMESDGSITILTKVANINPATDNDQANEKFAAIVLSIADTGPGIPSEHLQHIFDPFFTTKANGTGLGLSVAHEIVIKHNGSVDVESTLGHGSVFRLFFPIRPNAELPS